jgi:hypothetical protein
MVTETVPETSVIIEQLTREDFIKTKDFMKH